MLKYLNIADRQQAVLHDKKWHKLLRRVWLLRHIPFVEIAFGSGSLAIGNVDQESDFDILIGARKGRIFTARFFAAIAFGVFGWRRKKMDHHDAAVDKICLNHFMTPVAYKLRLSPNAYWKALYERLVPLYGSPAAIQAFFDANAGWLGQHRVLEADHRYQSLQPSGFKKITETILDAAMGDWVEEKMKTYQIRRIERGLPNPALQHKAHQIVITGAATAETIKLPPLIMYTDEELEFHPDPAAIEMRL
jgi:hypothetical protein